MLICTHVHANQCIPVMHMHNFSPLWWLQWVTKQNRGLTPSGFNFCDPSSSLWSRHRAAEQRPFGNICGQLRGEEGAKERNLLLINKIMGAIRPFSHHRCSQSLPLFPLSRCASLYLTFAIKITFIIHEWDERLWEKTESARKQSRWGKIGGWCGWVIFKTNN